jgi:hypothetical protein
MTIQIRQPEPEHHPDLRLEDLIVNAFVPTRLQAFDKELFGTKWWDYRFDSPFEATLRYVQDFSVQARALYARDIDKARAQHIYVVSPRAIVDRLMQNDRKAKEAFSGFWRGRQVADALGMPYATFIYEAVSQRMRRWQRAYLPNSSQIYQDANIEVVAARWDELQRSRIHYAEHHAYLAQNYQNTPIQTAYYDALFDRAERTGDRIMTLVDMVEADRISLDYLAEKDSGICKAVRASLP